MSEAGVSAFADEVGIARPNLSAALKAVYPKRANPGGSSDGEQPALGRSGGRRLPALVRRALPRWIRLHSTLGLPRAVVSWVLRDELHLLQLAHGAIDFRPLLRLLPESEARWHERANAEQRGAYFEWAWPKAHTPLLDALKISQGELDQVLQDAESSADRDALLVDQAQAGDVAPKGDAEAPDEADWWRIPSQGWAPAVLSALRRTVPKQYLLGVARCGAGCQVVLMRGAPERINALMAEYLRRGVVAPAFPYLRAPDETVAQMRGIWRRVAVRSKAPDATTRMAKAALALDVALATRGEEETLRAELIEAVRSWMGQFGATADQTTSDAGLPQHRRSHALPRKVAAAIAGEWSLEGSGPSFGVSYRGDRVRVHLVCLPPAGTMNALELPPGDFAIVTRLVGQENSGVFELLYAGAVCALCDVSPVAPNMLDARALRSAHSRIDAAHRLRERSNGDEGAAAMGKRDADNGEGRNHDDLHF